MFNFFKRNLKFWVISLILGGIFGFILYFLLPPVYEAKVRCVPNFSQSGVSASSLIGVLTGIQSGENVLQISLAIIKSDRMADDIVKKFNLMEYFKVKDLSKARKKVKKILKIKINPMEGTMEIKVRIGDPNLAADIANFCVKNVDRLNEKINLSNVKPILKVIDPAIPPKEKFFPKIKVLVPLFSFLFFIVTVFILAFKEWTKHGGGIE